MNLWIEAITNGDVQEDLPDGLVCTVQFRRAPSGTPSFYATRKPGPAVDADNLKPAVVVAGSANKQWVVTLRDNSTDEPPLIVRSPYYVVAVDNAGESNLGGQWISFGTGLDLLDQIEETVHDLLYDNRLVLDAGLQLALGARDWPNEDVAAVKKIFRGQPDLGLEEGFKFPRVAVDTEGLDEDLYFANPYSDYLPIRTRILTYAVHQGDVDWKSTCRALGMAVMDVLNQPYYLSHTLDCGLRIYECHVQTGAAVEELNPALKAYVSAFDMNWLCGIHKGKYPIPAEI